VRCHNDEKIGKIKKKFPSDEMMMEIDENDMDDEENDGGHEYDKEEGRKMILNVFSYISVNDMLEQR
jgi:hypothetical protein